MLKKKIKRIISIPWISARKNLLIRILFDLFFLVIISISLFSYSDLFLNKSFLFYKLNLLIISWIFVNYILGKYSDQVNYSGKFYNQIFFFIKLELTSLALVSTFFYLIERLLNSHTNLDIFYLILNTSLISFVVQNLYSFLIKKNKNSSKKKWLFISSREKFDFLENLLKKDFSSLNFKLQHANEVAYNNLNNYSGIIIDNSIKKKILINYKKLNLVRPDFEIMKISQWCELYLQRLPHIFVPYDFYYELKDLENKKHFDYRFKRVFDIVISLLILFISSPILLIAILLIWIEDKGPLLYSQKRTGFLMKDIKIYKLRTMKVNAEDTGIQWSISGDRRITKIGRYLRKTRLDELPQLINVLRGEMSLIGPRPERPEIDQKLEKDISKYNYRYLAKPGLSGWAQVNSSYAASIESTKLKLSYDLFYLYNFNIWIDFLIFFKTMKTVFNAKGSIAKED